MNGATSPETNGNADGNARHNVAFQEPQIDSFPHAYHPSDGASSSEPARRPFLSAEQTFAHPENSIMDPPSSAHSASLRGAARELLGLAARRSRRSIVDVRNRSSFRMASASSFLEGSSVANLDEETAAPSAAAAQITNLDSQDSDSEDIANVSLLSESVQQPSYGSTHANHSALSPNGRTDESPSYTKHPTANVAIDTGIKYHRTDSLSDWIHLVVQQSSAVAVVALLNMMIAIPFGASYFPVGWKSIDRADSVDGPSVEDDGVDGTFPLPGKVALGIRMFLFATAVGQFCGTFASKFSNPVYLQMVENVPFLHALAYIVIQEQGYGEDALSTLFFLFGLSSVVVGITFYVLGKMELGRIVYFFPSHVLVGCIGGIGAFIITTAIEVTNNVSFTFDRKGVQGFVDNFHLFSIAVLFEITLRVLIFATQDKNGRPRFQLLTPVFYCLITPVFYIGMFLFGTDMETARSQGYFFPSMMTTGAADGDSVDAAVSVSSSATDALWSMLQDEHLFDIFTIVDIRTVSWTAVFHCTGTMIALAAFSLIHVPINIPAFAISTDVDTDMNAELISHGYANFASGLFGGLQTYMCYSNSVLYAKSGGNGKVSSIATALVSVLLFVIGPAITSFLPRCMAGTLLLHLGIDLVLEGVYDSWGSYDNWEYAGIWIIALVMTFWGMTAALLAGVIAAMSTYAVQSMTFQNPIRQIMRATTLRSSAWNRCANARRILDDHHSGRSRILIFQLQGHLFFGNVAQLTDTIKETLKEQKDTDELPLIVIIDFTLVVGMDSSAAHAVQKLKKIVHRLFHVEVCIFVTGVDRGGFPCEYALTQALNEESDMITAAEQSSVDWNDISKQQLGVGERPADDNVSVHSNVRRGSVSVAYDTAPHMASRKFLRYSTGRVCESLDEALIFAEDVLVARVDDSIEHRGSIYGPKGSRHPQDDFVSFSLSPEEERQMARRTMYDLFVEIDKRHASTAVETLLSVFERQEYSKGDMLWEESGHSGSAMFLVTGTLLSYIEGTNNSEVVYRGNFIGELGLVSGTNRLSSLRCISDRAVVYVLDMAAWERLKREHQVVAAMFNEIVVRYLAHRVQHVSNRYFGTTLPI